MTPTANQTYERIADGKLAVCRLVGQQEVQYVFLKDGKLFGPTRFSKIEKFIKDYRAR